MACVGRRRSHARDKGQDEDHLQVRKGGEGDCRDDAARVGGGGGGENGPLATYLSVRVKPEDFNCPESVKALLKFESRRDCKVAEIHEYVQQTARQSSHPDGGPDFASNVSSRIFAVGCFCCPVPCTVRSPSGTEH